MGGGDIGEHRPVSLRRELQRGGQVGLHLSRDSEPPSPTNPIAWGCGWADPLPSDQAQGSEMRKHLCSGGSWLVLPLHSLERSELL